MDGTPAHDPAARLTQLWTMTHRHPPGAAASPQRSVSTIFHGSVGCGVVPVMVCGVFVVVFLVVVAVVVVWWCVCVCSWCSCGLPM